MVVIADFGGFWGSPPCFHPEFPSIPAQFAKTLTAIVTGFVAVAATKVVAAEDTEIVAVARLVV